MQSFGATLTVGPFFWLMGQTILVAFSLTCSLIKMILSNSQKLRKAQTARASRVPCSSSTRGTGIFPHTSLPSTRNMNAKVAVELYYIVSKMSVHNFSLTLSIHTLTRLETMLCVMCLIQGI